MSTQQAVRESKNATIWVVSSTEEGFRVYNAADRNTLYTVGGSPEAPECSCRAFQWSRKPCEHIDAVFRQVSSESNGVVASTSNGSHASGDDYHDVNEVMMTLKRSVSPDGRIDSLSVEFSAPVDSNGNPTEYAQHFLEAQKIIVESFRNGNGQANGHTQSANGNGSMEAQIVSVGGMNTKWGWRTFLNVSVNGQTLRLFGSRKQLAEQLVTAGYAHLGSNLNNGATLNVPCRVTLKQSDDGKYTNVEQLLPPARG